MPALLLITSVVSNLFLLLYVTPCASKQENKPNLLLIMTDQQRFDAVGRVQEELAAYKGKLHIHTPNLDRLSRAGAYFERAYSQSPVCAPVRTSLRTGCTLRRSGVQTNKLIRKNVYDKMNIFKERVEALQSLDQILVERNGYTSEYYGKWHIPNRLYYRSNREKSSLLQERVIAFNDFDYETGTFVFTEDSVQNKYRRYLEYSERHGVIDKNFTGGSGHFQEDLFSCYPYDPIRLDARNGYPPNTPLKESQGFKNFEITQPNVLGRFALASKYTSSHFTGDIAVKALDRLVREQHELEHAQPFALTVSFHSPHPPMVTPSKYLDRYWMNRYNLSVPLSIHDSMSNSAYRRTNGRLKLLEAGHKFNDPEHIQEWTALYYALVQEIDDWVGTLLSTLELSEKVRNNTLVIFTSDHGEMLGAHAMREKNVFLEESVRVPLFLVFPRKIQPGTRLREPVAHLDLLSTILDYLGIEEAGDDGWKSDGTSLRRFIERQSYNEHYDERVTVSEWNFREPITSRRLTRNFGSETNFMVTNGRYKLVLTNKASSDSVIDMMYDLQNDPYETENLLGENGMTANDEVIGKAEHLRILLLEWMVRMDGGSMGYFSKPIYNNNEGEGDMAEIEKRQKWRSLDIWVGDKELEFGSSVWDGQRFVRNEYLYVGRRTEGAVRVENVTVTGMDAHYFAVDINGSNLISERKYLRIKVTFSSTSFSCPLPVNKTSIDANVRITYDPLDTKNIDVPIIISSCTENESENEELFSKPRNVKIEESHQ